MSNPKTIRLGTWWGGFCTATPYPGAAFTAWVRQIIYGSDETAAAQSVVNALGLNQRAIIRETHLIRDTIVFRNKTGGEFGGITGNGQVRALPFSGSNIVWAGPGRKPMFRFENTGGMYIHDLHFVGNSNPRNRPSALIDIAQTIRMAIADKFVGISNMASGCLYDPTGRF